MHEKMGLTHTDLKPENILLKLDTKKKITDQS
jgi:serine/threonine protein kinase